MEINEMREQLAACEQFMDAAPTLLRLVRKECGSRSTQARAMRVGINRVARRRDWLEVEIQWAEMKARAAG